MLQSDKKSIVSIFLGIILISERQLRLRSFMMLNLLSVQVNEHFGVNLWCIVSMYGIEYILKWRMQLEFGDRKC